MPQTFVRLSDASSTSVSARLALGRSLPPSRDSSICNSGHLTLDLGPLYIPRVGIDYTAADIVT